MDILQANLILKVLEVFPPTGTFIPWPNFAAGSKIHKLSGEMFELP